MYETPHGLKPAKTIPTVSFAFLLTISAVAAATGVLVFVAPNPVYNLATLLLTLYAIHRVGLRIALRKLGDPQETQRRLVKLQAELDRVTAELQVERAERATAEQEWIGWRIGGER
jgi:hypothetical protein